MHIWNLITRDTREGQILDRLFQKLDNLRQALGSERVFDVISEMIPGAHLGDAHFRTGSLDPQPQDQAHDLDGAQVDADAVPANLVKV